MFNTNAKIKKLQEQVDSLIEEKKELSDKAKERDKLRSEIEDLKSRKKIEEQEIRHMVKMKEERLQLEHEKKIQETEAEKEREVAKVKDAYRDKMETRLEAEVQNMKEMYGQILERLPNVTARLKGEV